VDAEPYRQTESFVVLEAGMECVQSVEHPQPHPDGALRIVFMGLRIAKVDQQSIAEILGNMPVKAGDHLGAGLVIGLDHLTVVFRIELTREACGLHQVTKQDGQLAPFGIRRGKYGKGRCWLADVSCVHIRVRSVLGGGEQWRWRRGNAPCPDQDAPALISGHLVRVQEFVLQIVQGLLIQLKLALECPIRHPLTLAQEIDDLIEEGIKVHAQLPLPVAVRVCP
jgi:hypothetical protein